jgi:hypothetical protein
MREYPVLAAGATALRPFADGTDLARFTLVLASRPGLVVTDWEASQRSDLLGRVLARPGLFRAARFAVLGACAFTDPHDTAYTERGAS